MKKLIITWMAVSCLLLCACGDTRNDDGILPDEMMPTESMMPDTEDGEVNDEDGVIEEREEDKDRPEMPGSTHRP